MEQKKAGRIRYLVFHTRIGDYRSRGTMSEMNESLHKEGFSECINGCLVNLRYVTKIEKDTVWVDDMPLPITRRRKKAFKEDFMRFLPYAAISLAVYFGVVRRYEGKGELKSRDMRMILLVLGILFTVVIISVLVDHPMFRGGQQRSSECILQNIRDCLQPSGNFYCLLHVQAEPDSP